MVKRSRIRDADKDTLKSHLACMVPLCLRCPHPLEWPVIPVPERVWSHLTGSSNIGRIACSYMFV